MQVTECPELLLKLIRICRAAGSDSTASTMHSFCWNVLSRPQVYQKLIDELLETPSSDLVQYNEALKLNYFQACLKEAMRLQPAVGFNITRYVPDSGIEIDGHWIPRGTQVAVNAWVLHRQKDAFGADAETFRPERWLESSAADIKRMERCLFQVSKLLTKFPCQPTWWWW